MKRKKIIQLIFDFVGLWYIRRNGLTSSDKMSFYIVPSAKSTTLIEFLNKTFLY